MSPHFVVYRSLATAWITLWLVWIVMAFRVKSTLKRQSARGRKIQVVLGGLAYILLFTDAFAGRLLSIRLVPALPAWKILGVALTYAGIAFAIWARIVLGRNWSSNVTLKEGHALVRSGPYALVRHPIYSGFLLAMFGTALVAAEAHAFLGVAVAFVAWRLKFREEERFMTEQFGLEYEEYRRRTPALLPFIL
jgi:protein-S-isoprenylcysteine O-methyltransferase Ste14